jgi:hypothetical protein
MEGLLHWIWSWMIMHLGAFWQELEWGFGFMIPKCHRDGGKWSKDTRAWIAICITVTGLTFN